MKKVLIFSLLIVMVATSLAFARGFGGFGGYRGDKYGEHMQERNGRGGYVQDLTPEQKQDVVAYRIKSLELGLERLDMFVKNGVISKDVADTQKQILQAQINYVKKYGITDYENLTDEQKKDLEAIQDLRIKAQIDRINQLVKDGKLTKEQGDYRIKIIELRKDYSNFNGTHKNFGGNSMRGSKTMLNNKFSHF